MVGSDAEPHEAPGCREPLDHVHLDRCFGVEQRAGGVKAGRTGTNDRDTERPAHDADASASSGGAAGTAAADGTFGLGAFFDLERVAAPAGGAGIRVVDREPGRLDGVDVVDLGALEVRRAERIDDHLDAVHLELEVAVGGAAVEAEPVLETRAAAALNGDAQDADVLLLGDQLLDLDSRSLGDGHQGQDSFLELHRDLIVATWAVPRVLRKGQLVTLVSGTVERFSPCFVPSGGNVLGSSSPKEGRVLD